ncbi:NAD(P)-binding domain-containing protein [Saccharopolyspora sp. NPDC050389]|uniref:NAD(P)-dependent oxidoreductase n=1 Tax=Saccharopolyspora sp. NPDC050389 TaxID=3155516 RepID=UPI0033EBAC29
MAEPSVTILGLGLMGTAIADAYLAAGYRVVVWNRSAAKADDLVTRGAVRASTMTDAITSGPLVIAPLLDCAATQAVLEQAGTDLSGRLLVNLANGTPEQARQLAASAAAHGADYLDGAMMALPQTVATPAAFFLYSGSRNGFTTHRAALEVMASAHYFGPDPAAAEVHDLAVLGTGYAALTGFLHAAALLTASAGATPTEFAPLASQWLRGMADFLPELAREAESRRYAEGVSTIDLNRASVDALIRISTGAGVDDSLHGPLQTLLTRRSAAGHGSDSFSSIFELLRPQHDSTTNSGRP